jgi:hypothetical protein
MQGASCFSVIGEMSGSFLRKGPSLLLPTFVTILLASLAFKRIQAILFRVKDRFELF